MKFTDYYATLGVEPNAGDAEIKTAYRRLARKFHPDVSKEAGAEDRFKSINEAYEALRDPTKRAAYDQLKARGYRPGDEVQPPSSGYGQGPAPGGYEDVFAGGAGGAGTGGFSDFFETLFRRQQQERGGPQQARGPAPSRDSRARFAVALDAVYRGDTVRVGLDHKTLDVRVPKGIRPGQVIRLTGQGPQGGNLLLEIEYAPHPQFEVDGLNIIHALPVAPWEAALGATVSVPTLGGQVDLKIPPGSEAGRKLRLRGRGLPAAVSVDVAGDQIVELEIQAPTPRDDAQREAYAALRETFAGDWRRE